MSRLNNPFWMLQEYIPAVSLDKLEGDNVKKYYFS